MKNLKKLIFISSVATVLLCLGGISNAQLVLSPLKLNVSNEPYVSIVDPDNRVPAGGFTPLTQSVPIDVNIDGLGTIDSIYFGIHFLKAISANTTNRLSLSGLSFNDDSFDFIGQTKHYLLITEEPREITIEFVIPVTNMESGEKFEYQYQVIFNETEQTYSYHYGSTPDNFPPEPDVYFVGTSFETTPERDLIWFDYLYGEPSNPEVAKTIEDIENFTHLDSMPAIGTKYTFSNLFTSVGEASILGNTRLEKTESGYRVFSQEKLTVSLVNMNGQELIKAQSFGSDYYYLQNINHLGLGIYLVRLENEKGEQAGYKIQL